MQANLFDDSSDADCLQVHQLGDGTLEEYPRAFTEQESENFMQALLANIPWRQEYLKIAGKVVAVPRLQCWMSDHKSSFAYSGLRLSPVLPDTVVDNIRQRVETLAAIKFNSVLINYYRNGQDSVAWHADDEPELGPDPLIASVSFGAERPFQLKRKRPAQAGKFQLTLRNGSILVMRGGLQENWLHQVPKVKDVNSPRINLTFRNIVRNP